MKSFKKMLALALSASLTVCCVGGSFLANAAETDASETLADISYVNTFDGGDTQNDLADFNTWWAKGGDGVTSLQSASAVESTYLTTSNGAMSRKPYVCSGWRADRDANKNLTITTLMTQTYSDLELTATMKLTDGGPGAMGFVLGQTKSGTLYYTQNAGTGTGYGVIFKRTGSGLNLLIASEGKVMTSPGVWANFGWNYVFSYTDYDKDFSRYTGEAGDSKPFKVKIKMNGTILSVFILNSVTDEWVQFGQDYELPDYQLGYVSMVHSNAQTSQYGYDNNLLDQYFDDFSVTGKGIDFLSQATANSSAIDYENSFNGITLSQVSEDFNMYYTDDCKSGTYASQPNYSQKNKYFYMSDGKLCMYKASGVEDWYEPWYATSLLTYKHSTFEDFELELDFNNNRFELIWNFVQFGTSSGDKSSWSSDGGYTFAWRNNGGSAQLIYNGSVTSITFEPDTSVDYATLKIAVKNKKLTASIVYGDDKTVEIYSGELVNYIGGYVSFGTGLGDTSKFDRFAIKGNAKAPDVKYTDSSIVFKPISGYEYSIDGGESWSSSNLFTGLNKDSDYTVAQRVAANKHLSASAASESVEVTTGTDGEAYGDLNGDFAVSAGDLVILRKELLGISSATNLSAADMNKDGYIDIIDMIQLKKAVA